MVSTRNHFICTSQKTIKPTRNPFEYDLPNSLEDNFLIPGLQMKPCPSDLIIFIHGIWNTEKNLQTTLFKLKKSLEYNNYFHPLVGFSWDSKVDGLNYSDLKKISSMNGSKLAAFIIDYKHVCKKIKIRLIGHSLGALLILNSLPFINSNFNSSKSKIKIDSVHLLGAAIENSLVSKNNNFGNYIENNVDNFFNFYSFNDHVLKTTKKLNRINNPMGMIGTKNISDELPFNFYERNVTKKLTEFKINYKKNYFINDHSIYVGYTDEHDNLIFDGVVSLIIQDWQDL
jgi:hypothetical protein